MDFGIKKIRNEFETAINNWTYLNAAACGLTPRFAKKATDKWWEDKLTNGSVNYHTWEENAEKTREKFGKLIRAKGEEIAYVMNTSQAINIAVNGIDFKKGDNVIANRLDFPSIYLPWLILKNKGVEIKCVNIEDNRIPVENIEKLIDEHTKAFAISSVQFKTGFKCDLEKIGKICKEKGIYFIVDAIQSLGVIEMEVKKYNIDMLATSCYKWLLGPDGIGFFYCDKDIQDEIASTNIGWMSTIDPWSFPTEIDLHPSAKKFESGTLPWPLIYSADSILEFFHEITVKKIQSHVFVLLDHLIEELQKLNVKIVSPLNRNERSGILTFDVKNRDKLAEIYQNNKVRISVRDGIRVSPHIYNAIEDIDRLVSILKKFLHK